MAVILDDAERTPCEVYTRVMGYHRPVTAFNAGKQQEHKDRRYFTESANGTHDMSAFRTGIQARL